MHRPSKKNDEVLKRLYETLRKNEQQSNRSFSVVYFADHGLAHHITENDIAIHNSSGKSKLHFDFRSLKYLAMIPIEKSIKR